MKSYGCHNQPRPTARSTYPAQDGWFYEPEGMTRKPRIIQIAHAMSSDCKYDDNAIDPGCTECQHQQKGNTSV